ncbi:MAG: glycosyltransferase family 61 protein [Candidatus Nanopelagicales bacterium]|nr:glycosyltransferase family 61 protein [Candidatus Nanopelagicales bacterium]
MITPVGASSMWSLENWAVDQSLPAGVTLIHDAPATTSVVGPPIARRYDRGNGIWRSAEVPAAPTPVPGLAFRVVDGRCVSRSGAMLPGMVWPTGSAWHAAVDVEAHAAFLWPTFADDPADTLDSGAWIGQAGDWVFGHCLLDVLPRAALLHAVLDRDVPFVASSTMSAALEGLLEMAGIIGRPIVRIPERENVLVRELYLATTARQGTSFDADRINVFANMRANALNQGSRSRGELIHLSRKQVHQDEANTPRHLVNRADVDATMAAAGYSIVSPETMPLAEQIQIIHSARAISGEVGSAMHLVMFAAPGTQMTVLRSRLNPNPLDPLCAGMGRAELNIVEGDPDDKQRGTDGQPARAAWIGSWHLDPAVLGSAMSQLRDLTDKQQSAPTEEQGESSD